MCALNGKGSTNIAISNIRSIFNSYFEQENFMDGNPFYELGEINLKSLVNTILQKSEKGGKKL